MTNRYRNAREIQAPPVPRAETAQAGPAFLKTLMALLAVLVMGVSGLGYFSVGRIGNEVTSSGKLELGASGKGTKGQTLDGAVDILLVGSDSRSDAQGNPLTPEEIEQLRAGDEEGIDNTDTLMVIRIPNDGSSATAISIPRDTYVHEEGYGNMKINGVYGVHKHAREEELVAEGKLTDRQIQLEAKRAGRQGLIRAIDKLTGVSIDHYAEVGLLGFVLLTDAVGGVEVCLNEPVEDEFSGANFPAGRQTLNGADALSFVRQRHGLPRGDLDRIVRQQAYMASLVNKVLAAGTLTNPSKLSDMGAAVERSVVIDEGWDVLSFATQLQNLAGGNVTFTTIPVTSIDGVGDYGESIVTVDKHEVHRFMKTLLGEDDQAQSAADKKKAAEDAKDEALRSALADKSLHVLNAGTTPGTAGRIAAHLHDKELSISAIANAEPGVYTKSQVVAASASDPAAKALADYLGVSVTTNAGLDSQTLIVVAHDDYQGPLGDQAIDDTDLQAERDEVGQPGTAGAVEPGPKIDAGGDGPRCVN